MTVTIHGASLAQITNLTVPLEGLAPDATYDPLRTVGNQGAPGDGVLAVGTRSPGASEVKSKLILTATNSSVRATAITPTSGKKIRILAIVGLSNYGALHRIGLYFGTGADFTTTVANAIARIFFDGTATTDSKTFSITFEDGAGPVGAVDAVLSIITSVDISANGEITIHSPPD